MELSEHLFRHEAGRMVATLTRIFGVHNLGLAEDGCRKPFAGPLRSGNSKACLIIQPLGS